MELITTDHIWVGFVIAFIAAVSTFAGALTSLYFRHVNRRTLSIILGFVGGIMLYTAFLKFLPEAMKVISAHLGYKEATIAVNLSFFFGILLLHPVGQLVHIRHKHEPSAPGDELHYRRLAILLLVAVMAHSFVEGIATFLSVLTSPLVAIPLVISIIVHNFPEGMTIGALFNRVSETTSLRKAVMYSVFASLCEPVGAITAYFFILKYTNPLLMGIIKAFLAGLLVATALNELIPNSQLKVAQRVSVQSIIAGMLIMGSVVVMGAVW